MFIGGPGTGKTHLATAIGICVISMLCLSSHACISTYVPFSRYPCHCE
ncbi:MAG: hypothetical protein VB032_01820 [Burkholderiaceae bacterium]|nr:hypothetical protein [Burkholderiaceae bacterium]